MILIYEDSKVINLYKMINGVFNVIKEFPG
jgi:hypothetical protein